jgi:hypothetical protein
MAAFGALTEFLDDALELPVPDGEGGTTTVRIPSPSGRDGLTIERIMEAARRLHMDGTAPDQEILDDAAERDLFRLAVGSGLYDELLDAHPWTIVRHVAMTAIVWITQNRDNAATYWATAGDPKAAAAPNRATRRASASTASGGASGTRSRGSTSGTRAGSSKSGSRKAAPKAGA